MKRSRKVIPVLLLACYLPISTGCAPLLIGAGTVLLVDHLHKKSQQKKQREQQALAQQSKQRQVVLAKQRAPVKKECPTIRVTEIK